MCVSGLGACCDEPATSVPPFRVGSPPRLAVRSGRAGRCAAEVADAGPTSSTRRNGSISRARCPWSRGWTTPRTCGPRGDRTAPPELLRVNAAHRGRPPPSTTQPSSNPPHLARGHHPGRRQTPGASPHAALEQGADAGRDDRRWRPLPVRHRRREGDASHERPGGRGRPDLQPRRPLPRLHPHRQPLRRRRRDRTRAPADHRRERRAPQRPSSTGFYQEERSTGAAPTARSGGARTPRSSRSSSPETRSRSRRFTLVDHIPHRQDVEVFDYPSRRPEPYRQARVVRAAGGAVQWIDTSTVLPRRST